MSKLFFIMIVITRCDVYKSVMLNNQGDVDFLHLMKIYFCLHYVNVKS